MAQRRVRLDQVLGAAPSELTWAHLEALVTDKVSETDEIEFKVAHYGNSGGDHRELAKDVAALANAVGGVILIGIREGAGGAEDLAPVSLDDAQLARYRQIVASAVLPLPDFELHRIRSLGDDNLGVLVLEVPRSTRAPHAVQVNDALRYPRRHGTTTIYLSEPDVAEAYRTRYLFGISQEQLASRREEEFLAKLDGSEPWLVLTAVPDGAGLLPVDRASLAAFQAKTVGRRAGPPWGLASQAFERARVGPRRMYADGGASRHDNWLGRSVWCALEVHADGSGCYAHRVVDLRERPGAGLPRPDDDHRAALDSHTAEALVAGLTWLGDHAWRAGAAGMLNLRATLWPVSPARPMALGHLAQPGFREEYGPPVSSTIPATTSARISSISEPGPELVAASAVLLRDIAQNFGVAELGLLSSTGTVRRLYWDQRQRQQLEAWCAGHDIELTDDLLT